jgi:predicted ATP-dependent serine protease
MVPRQCVTAYIRLARKRLLFRVLGEPSAVSSLFRQGFPPIIPKERNRMKLDHLSSPALRKAPSGITGFDEITGGGLPRGRTTLLLGGPGSGKTIFALQYLINGARVYGEPGIFVAFEETSQRILANAASFDWKLDQLRKKNCSLSMRNRVTTSCRQETLISAECWPGSGFKPHR